MAERPRVQSLAAFATERGLTTEYDVLSHIHAGLRSAPQTKTYDRWNKATLARLQAEADATKAAYHAALEVGEVVAPVVTLEDRANGHPDLESTKAAQRLLEKRRRAILASEGTAHAG